VLSLRWCSWLYPAGLLALLACGDNSGVPETGSLVVHITTTGDDLDPDGYVVRVDSLEPHPVGVNETLIVPEVARGDHTVEVGDLASNCNADGENPKVVSLQTPGASEIAFQIACIVRTGMLQVRTFTSGNSGAVDGYVVWVDGDQARGIAPTGAVAFLLLPGDHQVLLDELPSSCMVEGDNPQMVSIAVDEIGRLVMNISCTG
jgi:hypothetical protein